MNAVIFYSNTGQSKRIATYFAQKTGDPLLELGNVKTLDFERVVLVFPVYSQNIPRAVKDFLRRVETAGLTAIAVYGGICHGNVLNEIQKKYRIPVIAAAYVPTKHAYCGGSAFDDDSVFDALLLKMRSFTAVKIPKSYKNPLANLAIGYRARHGVTIVKDAARCTRCGVCNQSCTEDAMRFGVPNRNCIRCLKCVGLCPAGALDFRTNFILNRYLRQKKRVDAEIFID